MFEAAGDKLLERAALWNGLEWLPLGSGLDRMANAIAVEPNGDLIVGGFFTTAGGNPVAHLAKWNGSSWSSYAGGVNGVVNCFGRMPNGDLLAGGTFTVAGSQSANRAAIWNGSTWTPVGSGIDNGEVKAILSRPNGDIAVAGAFTQAGGLATGPLAVWNGSTWISPGVSPNSLVAALANDTNGDLLIGGLNLNPLGAKFARWDGTSLQFEFPPVSNEVRSILVESSGSIVVGSAVNLGNGPIQAVARLTNGNWSLIKTGPHVTSLVEHNGKLVAAGGYIGAVTGPNIEEFDGVSWSSLGGVYSPVLLRHVAADPSGGVIVAGILGTIGNQPHTQVAHWQGSNWSTLGSGINGDVTDMVMTTGGDLVVAGEFTIAGSASANHIASWNGSNWATLGAGFAESALKLASLRAGGVVALFAQQPSVRVFDGSTWTALPQPAIQQGAAVAVVEMPNGDLVVGTGFSNGVLRWDGSVWSTMSNLAATELALRPDGTLLAAGNGVYEWDGSAFQLLGVPFHHIRDVLALPNGDVVATGSLIGPSVTGSIVRWDGNAWTPVDGGTSISFNGANVVEEAAFTSTGELVAVGRFGALGQVATANIARAVSTCPATATVFGAGCTGSAGSVSMVANNQPWLGSTFEAQTNGMAPLSLAVQAIGTSNVLVSLPMGAPGCSLYLQPALLTLAVPVAGTVATNFAIPATAALVGVSVRTQTIGVELDAAMSITSLTSSNALDLTIGAF